jgi:hypothetical protein
MGSLQAPVFMAVGQMGSGKSHYVREILAHYIANNLAPLVVILNTTEELAEYAAHCEVFDLDRLERGYTAAAIADLMRLHKRTHFEIADYGKDMEPFLEQFWTAVKSLGTFNADGCTVLLVVDESHVFLSKEVFNRPAKVLCTESRKFGVHICLSTQKLASTSRYTIHQLALNAVNVWAVFPTSEPNNRKTIENTVHHAIPDPASFAMPDPGGGLGPEYLIVNRLQNTRGMIRRQPDGSRTLNPLAQ